MRYVFVSTLLLASMLLAACGSPATPAPGPGSDQPTATSASEPVASEIAVAGSTSVQPLAEVLAEAFMAINPGVSITVQGGGSSVGVKSAGEGTADIGTASRTVKEEELAEFPNLQVFTIARDGIAIVVHPEVPVDGLATDEVKAIYEGSITMWSEVGGPSVPIIVVGREEGSGTRGAFGSLIMGDEEFAMVETAILQPSNGAVRTTVSTTPNSIGFLSFGYLDSSIKPLAIDDVEATVENALSGEYPVVRPLNMLTEGEPSGAVKDWLDFILSSDGQAIVADEGYIVAE